MSKRILVIAAVFVFVAGFVFVLGRTVSVTAAPGDEGETQTGEARRLALISEETGLLAASQATSPDCVYDSSYTVYLCPPAGPVARPVRDPAAAARAQELLGGSGLLLVPDSTNDRVMAFDATTGDLVDADFIPSDPTHLVTPKNAILSAAGDTILVSDQIQDVVHEYDMEGNYIGIFAPAGGPNPAILDNIIGLALRPNGNLLVTVTGGANEDSVAEFDTAGNYLGNFVPNGAGGMDGPFDIYRRSADWLVANINSDDINRHDLDTGAFLAEFAPINNFPQQLAQAANGNILVGNFSGTQVGVVEFTPAGSLVGVYAPVTGNRGAYELPNGNILTTNGTGVHEIDRAGNLVETKIGGVSAQYIELAQSGGGGPRLDEIEPNDVYTQSTSLPVPGPIEVTGNITPAGDLDWFSMAAQAGNLFFGAIRTGESTTGADSQLRVYAPDGTTEMEFDDDDGDDGGLGSTLASVIAGLVLTDTDNYYLRLNEFNNDGPITPYRLYVHLHDPADMILESEPNDTPATADSLTSPSLVSGTIDVSGNDDWYAITLAEGETLFAALDGDPGRPPNSGNDFNLSLYAPDGTTLIWLANDVGANDPANPPAEAGTYDAPTDGTYYLLVEGSGSVTGDYLLSVGVIPAVNPAVPAISLAKTVGTDPDVCATGNQVEVTPDTDVFYCYEVTNTGNVTLTTHDLVDSELGTLLNAFPFNLSPAASAYLTAAATIVTDTFNSATWTAYNPGPSDVVSATSAATVTVLLLPDIEVSPDSLASTQLPDTQVVQTLTIDNVGDATLDWQVTEVPAAGQERLPAGNGPTITSTFTTAPPAIDGSIGGAEWAGAFSLDIGLTATPVIMYIMHDADTLYLAFDDQADVTLDGFDQIGVYFDDEGGTPPILYDNGWLNPACGPDNTGEGNYWLGNFTPDPDDQWREWIVGPVACAVQYGGTNALIAYSASTGHMQYETAIPVDGSSALVVGEDETFGFRVYTAHTGALFTGRWPEPSTFNNPATYGNLHLPAGGCEEGDIPWLTVAPTSGSTGPGGSSEVDVTFDSAGLTPGTYNGNLCVESNDPDESTIEVPVTLTVTEEPPPPPAISLSKTVGVDPDSCAAGDVITVTVGTAVTYCYSVSNTGTVTVTTHDLVDSELGTILNGFPLVLAPGGSTFVTQTVIITQTTVNNATWTAYTGGGEDASASDSATVFVEVEEIEYKLYLPVVVYNTTAALPPENR